MKQLRLLVLLVLGSFSALAQTTDNSLLWEISGKGLQEPSYLFGTIHMICKDDFVMTEVVKEKFNQSKEIYLELDMDDPSLQLKMMKLMALKDGASLKSIFGEKGYVRIDSFFKAEMGMSVVMFNGFKPFMVMSLMYQKMLACDAQESYEMTFMKMAKESGKDIKGLETMEAQIAVFDSIPDSEEAASILKMIDEYEKQQQEFSKMVRLYKEQNIDQLYSFTTSSPDMMGSEALLLSNRNKNWIPVMEAQMKTGNAFFAVGAAHLGGPEGVIALLKKAGYTVKAVKI
jgi:uncharacterized protein YbaP (TraB family)